MKYVKFAAGGVTALALVGVVGGSLIGHTADRQASRESRSVATSGRATALDVGEVLVTPNAETLPPLTQKDVAELDDAGLVVRSVADASGAPVAVQARADAVQAEPVVSVGSAVAEAGRQFSKLLVGQKPTEASLVELTTPQLGKETESDPGKPSKITPEFQDRLAWAVYYPNASVPNLAPLNDPTDERSGSFSQPMVVFVDATSGEFLMAEST